jgi:GNAT superfamily N-acetyltransferase
VSPAQRVDVVRTFLEISDPADLRPPPRPPRREFELRRVSGGATSRRFYEVIGGPYGWTDRLSWTEAQWERWAARVETRAIVVDDQDAGYFELEPGRGIVTLAYLGLLEPYQGIGIGGHVLTAAIRRGFEIAPRVQVNTGTLDAPHALANYEARGMRVIRRRRETQSLDRPV